MKGIQVGQEVFVVTPAGVEQIKPVTTGTTPDFAIFESFWHRFLVSSKSTSRNSDSSLVTMISRASTGSDSAPSSLKWREKTGTISRSPKELIKSRERELISRRRETPVNTF